MSRALPVSREDHLAAIEAIDSAIEELEVALRAHRQARAEHVAALGGEDPARGRRRVYTKARVLTASVDNRLTFFELRDTKEVHLLDLQLSLQTSICGRRTEGWLISPSSEPTRDVCFACATRATAQLVHPMT